MGLQTEHAWESPLKKLNLQLHMRKKDALGFFMSGNAWLMSRWFLIAFLRNNQKKKGGGDNIRAKTSELRALEISWSRMEGYDQRDSDR